MSYGGCHNRRGTRFVIMGGIKNYSMMSSVCHMEDVITEEEQGLLLWGVLRTTL